MREVNLSDSLVAMAQSAGAAHQRTAGQQIEYWARLGKAAEDNPELPNVFIQQIMQSLRECGGEALTEYRYGPG